MEGCDNDVEQQTATTQQHMAKWRQYLESNADQKINVTAIVDSALEKDWLTKLQQNGVQVLFQYKRPHGRVLLNGEGRNFIQFLDVRWLQNMDSDEMVQVIRPAEEILEIPAEDVGEHLYCYFSRTFPCVCVVVVERTDYEAFMAVVNKRGLIYMYTRPLEARLETVVADKTETWHVPEAVFQAILRNLDRLVLYFAKSNTTHPTVSCLYTDLSDVRVI